MNGIFAEQEPAVGVAVAELVVGFRDEIAPAILGDGVGTGGDEDVDERVLPRIGDGLDVLLGAGDEVFGVGDVAAPRSVRGGIWTVRSEATKERIISWA